MVIKGESINQIIILKTKNKKNTTFILMISLRQPNNLYIYDLPPHRVNSIGIVNMIEHATGIKIAE